MPIVNAKTPLCSGKRRHYMVAAETSCYKVYNCHFLRVMHNASLTVTKSSRRAGSLICEFPSHWFYRRPGQKKKCDSPHSTVHVLSRMLSIVLGRLVFTKIHRLTESPNGCWCGQARPTSAVSPPVPVLSRRTSPSLLSLSLPSPQHGRGHA